MAFHITSGTKRKLKTSILPQTHFVVKFNKTQNMRNVVVFIITS